MALTQTLVNDNIHGEGLFEDGARRVTKYAVGSIPLIGDLIINTGITDSVADWIGDNIWNPIKRFFGGEL